MHAVFLDSDTLGNDVDYAPLHQTISNWTIYPSTSDEQLLQHIANADIVVTNKCPLDHELLLQLPNLKYISVAATGTNVIDLKTAADRKIAVSNAQAYGTTSVTQHVFALMLSLATRLPDYHRASTDGRWSKSPIFCLLDYPIMELKGKNLGIIGHGELGQAVGKMGEAFGMNVLISEHKNATTARSGRLLFDDVLHQADVLSLHCPLNSNTENLISFNEFKKMRSHALLINCARGGIVNEADLRKALELQMIGGAGVDVLTEEPPRNGNVLLSNPPLSNLIITPHSAWASREARQQVVNITAANIRSFLNGEIQNQVN